MNISKYIKGWQSRLALMILVTVYAISVWWVNHISREQRTGPDDDRKVIRLVHRIADESVVQGFKNIAREYEQLHPDVKVYVQSIPKRAYNFWCTTQCIGGTAPDLMQAEDNVWDPMWKLMAVRYMIPFSRYISQPNPYNQDTKLEGVAWRDTFIDGMISGYWGHLTEYYSVPLTLETRRFFYNKELLQKAAGSDKPPQNFAEWMEMCERIKEYSHNNGQMIFPIAGAKYNEMMMDVIYAYYYALTAGMIDPYDRSYWGQARVACTFFALKTGQFTFNQPRIRAAFELIKHVAKNCQPGFLAADSSQARTLFTQGKAVMMMGMTKDVKIMESLCDFEFGLFNFPLPSKDDPEYGRYVGGRRSEANASTIHFCLSKFSKYPEVAVDFLRYCTSLKGNEKFNAEVNWYPIVRYARPLEKIRAFEPQTEGAWRIIPFVISSQVNLWFRQNFPLFLNGEINYEQFSEELKKQWLTKGVEDFEHYNARIKFGFVQAERNIARGLSQMLFEEAGEVEAGSLVGDRSLYELSLETRLLLENNVTSREYIWEAIKKGEYSFNIENQKEDGN